MIQFLLQMGDLILNIKINSCPPRGSRPHESFTIPLSGVGPQT